MNNTWSDQLIEETRDVLDLGFVPVDDFVHMKNINGNFGKINLNNWLARKLIIQDKATDSEYVYATVDELIATGWAVD
ncbi:MAG: hypothetical protein ABL884_03560 [Methyloglobulus sp.]